MVYTRLAWERTNTVRLDEEAQITQKLVDILDAVIYSPSNIEDQVEMAQFAEYKLVPASMGRHPRAKERSINAFWGDLVHLQFSHAFVRAAKQDPLLTKLTLAFDPKHPKKKQAGPDVLWSAIAAWDVTTWKSELQHVRRDAKERNLWDAYYILIYD